MPNQALGDLGKPNETSETGVVRFTTHDTPSNGVEKKSSKPRKPTYSEDFGRFWAAFPAGRKKSKGVAWKSWTRARDRAPAAEIISAAIEYAASDEGRGEFCKMPSTWLNGDCWEDDRAAWGTPGAKESQADYWARQVAEAEAEAELEKRNGTK